MKKHLVRIALGLLVVVTFLGHAAEYYDVPFVDRLEAIIYDTRLRLTMPRTVDRRIVIVDIDERSLRVEGQWPWRRDRLGLLLDRLFDQYHASVVGFDVVFAERDHSSGLTVLQELSTNKLRSVPGFQAAVQALRPTLEFDRIFADKMHDRPVVLGYYFNREPEDAASRVGLLPDPVLPKGVFEGRNVAPTRWTGYGANLPELQEASASAGHFNASPDADGVSRRMPMLAEFRGDYYESFALAVLRLLLGSPPVVPGFPDAPPAASDYPGLEWLDVGQYRIPVDRDVAALIPYRGPERSFAYISATDVLQGVASRADLEGRIVLVGATAPGLLDLRSAPVGHVYPGVEIHANLISGVLDGRLKQMPPYVLGAELSLLALVGLVLALVLPLLNPLRATLVTAGFLAAVVVTNVAVWEQGTLALPLASGVLMIALLFALNMSYGFFVESRAKRQITRLFGQYVPPELVDVMSRDPRRFSMEGESREMTVLFSDVRGFTTISEGLDPKELSRLMNEFLTPLTQVIYRHRGTIDKYMGDCIMAFWGAPVPDAQHARSAVLTGLEMLATMETLELQLRKGGWPQLQIGVGVNSGRMSVGNMGSEIRVAYTVMGDAVNLASRLEGLTKKYGVGMIVGEATRAACTDLVFRELDRVKAKGKTEPVAIYEPIAPVSVLDQRRNEELSLWHRALTLYRDRQWDVAERQLIDLQKLHRGGTLYAEFLSRIAVLRKHPPGPEWDGTWTHESK